MKYFLLSITLLISITTNAQNTIAKFKYEDAEKAFNNGNYQSCLSYLDEAEKLLGKPAPNILYLRIMAESKIWEAHPYDSIDLINKLRYHIATYLQDYDIAGLENKYRDVYDISKKLSNAVPKEIVSQDQLTQVKLQMDEAKKNVIKEQAIADHNLVFVKGGTFTMGKGKDAHEVTLNDFYIGKYEVTQGEYPIKTSNGNKNKPRGYMTKWEDCMTYCKALEKIYGGTWRLPTEAEWEYAARGGQGSQGFEYSGSNDYTEVAANSGSTVGSKKPNELGIYDMSGNLIEWCYDFYDKDYFKNSPKDNPMGPDSGDEHVLRGGFGIFCSKLKFGVSKMKVYDRQDTPEKWLKHANLQELVGFRVVYFPDK